MLQRSELPVELRSSLNNLAYMLRNLRDYNRVSKRTGHPGDSHTAKHPYRRTKNAHYAAHNPYHSTQNPYYTTQNPYHTTQNPYRTTKNPYRTTQNPYHTAQNPYLQPELSAPRLPSLGQFFPLPSAPTRQTLDKHKLPKYEAVPRGQTRQRGEDNAPKMEANINAVSSKPFYPMTRDEGATLKQPQVGLGVQILLGLVR